MKVIVLAAGFSTRLYPLTHYFPKGLLPIHGTAITGYVLNDLVKNTKIKDIAFLTNHRYAPLFDVWLKANYATIKLIDNGVTEVDKRLGAIGDLLYVLNQTNWNDDLLVLSSDTLTSLKLSEFIEFFQTHRGVVNSIFDTKDAEIIRKKLGCAVIAGEKIIQFIEKPENPPTTLTSIPFYIFPKEAIPLIRQYVSEGNPLDAPGSIVPWLIGKLPVFAFKTTGYYFDVGTIEVYNKLAAEFRL
jgi:glucose-1-phosphate thymidylyltransferase